MTSPTRKQRKSVFLLYLLAAFYINILLLGLFFFLKYHPTNHNTDATAQKEYPETTALAGKNYTFQELSDYFTDLANKKTARYAYQVLKVAPIPPGTDMHLLGHVVGDILYKQEGINGIYQCTQDFRNACSHSIVVALFLKDGVKAIDTITDVCKKAPGGSGAYGMCFHGLGHGVLAYADYKLDKAIQLCQQTNKTTFGNEEYVECTGGSVMEMMSGVHDTKVWNEQKKKYFSDTDALYPCKALYVPGEVKYICYIYLTPHLFEYVGTDMAQYPTEQNYKDSFKLCDAIPKSEKGNRDACYGGFGKEFVVIAQYRDIRNIDKMSADQVKSVYSWCGLADNSEGKNSCIQYALGSLFWGGENKQNAAILFCDVMQDKEDQSLCVNALTSLVSRYTTSDDNKKSFCLGLPKSYQANCAKKLEIAII